MALHRSIVPAGAMVSWLQVVHGQSLTPFFLDSGHQHSKVVRSLIEAKNMLITKVAYQAQHLNHSKMLDQGWSGSSATGEQWKYLFAVTKLK